MRAKFVRENMQMPFHNDGNIPIIQKYPLDNPNIIGDCAYDNRKKKKRRKIRKANESVNESFSIPLTIAAAYCLYRFIKGLIKQHRESKMTPDERYEDVIKRLDVVRYKILLKYIDKYLQSGGKVRFEEDYLYYKFIVNEVTIKIDKNNRKIFWTNLDLDHFGGEFKPAKNKMRLDTDIEESDYIDPIPISQEEIDGLVEAIKEDNEIKD